MQTLKRCFVFGFSLQITHILSQLFVYLAMSPLAISQKGILCDFVPPMVIMRMSELADRLAMVTISIHVDHHICNAKSFKFESKVKYWVIIERENSIDCNTVKVVYEFLSKSTHMNDEMFRFGNFRKSHAAIEIGVKFSIVILYNYFGVNGCFLVLSNVQFCYAIRV